MEYSQFQKFKNILETPLDENLRKFSENLIKKFNLKEGKMKMGLLKKELKAAKVEFKPEEVSKALQITHQKLQAEEQLNKVEFLKIKTEAESVLWNEPHTTKMTLDDVRQNVILE